MIYQLVILFLFDILKISENYFLTGEIMRYISPRSDIAFKKLFADKDHKNLTIHFLNAVLKLPAGKLIVDVTFLDTTSFSSQIDGKEVIFDVYCIDEQKNRFIIEMQSLNEYDFFERSQYYVARAVAVQLKKADSYKQLLPVIFVGVVNYCLDNIHKDKKTSDFRLASTIKLEEEVIRSDDVVSHYSLINRATGQILPVPLMEFHFVELPKFKKTIEECHNVIDAWLFFMKNAELCFEIPEQMKDSKTFVEAFNIIAQKNWTQQELEQYVKEQDSIGKEERLKEGAYAEKTQEFAMKLLQADMDFDFIAEMTGLSIDQIKNLKNK